AALQLPAGGLEAGQAQGHHQAPGRQRRQRRAGQQADRHRGGPGQAQGLQPDHGQGDQQQAGGHRQAQGQGTQPEAAQQGGPGQAQFGQEQAAQGAQGVGP